MDLFYILLNQHEFSVQQLIYAELPWTLQSRAIMIEAMPSPCTLITVDQTEYRFFLPLILVRRLLGFYSHQNLCFSETCQRLIEFASGQHQHSPF